MNYIIFFALCFLAVIIIEIGIVKVLKKQLPKLKYNKIKNWIWLLPIIFSIPIAINIKITDNLIQNILLTYGLILLVYNFLLKSIIKELKELIMSATDIIKSRFGG